MGQHFDTEMKLFSSFLTLALANEARDPFERLEALQAKAQEVILLGGWKSDSGFAGRVAKVLERTSNDANWRRKAFTRVGCQFPEHWDWQAYLESQTDDRYNRDDPCKAVEQVFLGFKRWIEIYAGDCRKSAEVQVEFLNRKSIKLDRLRDKMFVDMQCDKYINKYDLDTVEEEIECEDGWTKFEIKGDQKCMKNFGIHRVHLAANICQSNAAELPLPQSEQANVDTYAAFKELSITEEAHKAKFALDGIALNYEAPWVRDSNHSRELKWFNWYPGYPDYGTKWSASFYAHIAGTKVRHDYLVFSNEVLIDNPYPFYSDAYDEFDIFTYETGPIWQDTWALAEVNVICQK